MNRRRALLSCLVLVSAAILGGRSPALAQDTSPESVGLSAERLERVAELMQSRIDARIFPGSVTLIARDNQVAWLRAQGVADVESGQPMRTDTVFRIMSMTKPVVALSVLIMVEEGKVRLTDPASRFIPELAGLAVAAPGSAGAPAPSGPAVSSGSAATVPAERELTVRDLLTHTSGLMSGGASSAHEVTIGPGDSLADVLPRLAGAPLDFQPGSEWAYSGQFGFDVLVRIVEVASGMPFDAFARQRIFEPLGMNDTFFHPAAEHAERIATLYRSVDGRLEEVPEMPFVNGVYFSGGGGLFSTAEDYLKFALVLLNDGQLDGVRLLGRRTMDLMSYAFAPDTLPGRTPGEAYGLGVRVVTDPAARNTLLSAGSFGWSGAFNTHFFIDPVERLVGIFMTQSAFLESRWQLRDDFETAVMQALVDEPPR